MLRKGKEVSLPATLAWRPLEVVRPESGDPLSFLTTIRQLDDAKLESPKKDDKQPPPPPVN